jgi:hypothetical protein
MRRDLNGEFYNSFSEHDRLCIAETKTTNNQNPWFGTTGGKASTDKIFLLSLEEAVKYFGDSGQLSSRPSEDTRWIDDKFNTARIAKNETGTASWWWLRSPGLLSNNASYVSNEGYLCVGRLIVVTAVGGVRPALWLKL